MSAYMDNLSISKVLNLMISSNSLFLFKAAYS